MKKVTAIVLALVMICCCLTGCGSKTEDGTVMTVNGTPVSYDEFMASFSATVSQLQEMYKNYAGTGVDWDGSFMYDDSVTNLEWCVKRAAQEIIRFHAVESKAKDMGVELTDDEKDKIESDIENIKSQYDAGDEESAAAFFASYGYTEDSYRTRSQLNYLYNDLFTKIYGEQGANLSDDKLQQFIEENGYVTSAHILYSFTETVTNADGTTSSQEISDEAKAEKKAHAEEVSKELQNIADDNERWTRFKEIMNEESDDPGKQSFPDGYCFTEGTMVTEYDEATRALEPYEVSGVVESQYGYHVIMRLPTKGTDLVSMSSMTVPLTYVAAPEYYERDVSEWANDATVKYTKLYDGIDFSKFISADGFNFVPYSEYSKSDKK